MIPFAASPPPIRAASADIAASFRRCRLPLAAGIDFSPLTFRQPPLPLLIFLPPVAAATIFACYFAFLSAATCHVFFLLFSPLIGFFHYFIFYYFIII
jgi:hypothetical protein